MSFRKGQWLKWAAVAASVGLVLVILAGLRLLEHRPPRGLMKDIRAGIAARDIEDPDLRLRKYLEGRYGSMDDPAHREAAFLDFFNLDHIKALQLLVRHSPEAHRQASIDAMARWLASYRAGLTAEERAALGARFQSGDGPAMLRRATAQYNCQDVRYRGSTVAVISELLRTVRECEARQP